MASVSYAPAVGPGLTIKRLALATDFSPGSERALSWAIQIAQTYGAHLDVVHFVPPKSDEALGGRAVEPLSRIDTQLTGLGIEHSMITHLDIGEAIPNALRELVMEDALDLVVLATHGRTGVSRLLHGSVAEAVFRKVPAPVLTLSPGLDESKSWPTIRKVLFATDFTPESIAAIDIAQSLALENAGELHLLHVVPSPRMLAGLKNGMPERRVAPLRQLARRMGVWNASFEIRYGDAAQEVLAVAREQKADIIVLGVRQGIGPDQLATHGPGRTAYEIVAGAQCPVLTYRAPRQSGSWLTKERAVV